MSGFVLGVDIGGTGSRVALARLGATDAPSKETKAASGDFTDEPLCTLTGPGVSIGTEGSNAPQQIRRLVATAREAWPDSFGSIRGIGIGATGIASLSTDVGELAQSLAREAQAKTAVAIDAVTAHLGALSGSGGAVTVLGTGAIAVSHPGPDGQGTLLPRWRRVDGWGHLFGDRGGGAWIGRRALEAALKCHDGVDPSGAALLAAAKARFGEPSTWPAMFYTRSDRAGLLAAFAIDVAGLARTGDPAAAALLAEAGREAACSAIAAVGVCGNYGGIGKDGGGQAAPRRIALAGGLRQAGEALIEAFHAEAERLSSETRAVDPAGDPLSGSLTLARHVAHDHVSSQPGVLWT
ncbi:BadF/BadG/BcrA/BcrD ATPase family protein [Brevibacterium marinum]|uniref:N-acetylglucosamine kinase-like BadF-type ATPase n=1 Tax=Brevibacterium marinum TaxID=418643 RepID=A0A846RYA6_9MICO|nr:N-acetylglucosamine kinase-like BadF-type ATPase [Brevibacterium marinum]